MLTGIFALLSSILSLITIRLALYRRKLPNPPKKR